MKVLVDNSVLVSHYLVPSETISSMVKDLFSSKWQIFIDSYTLQEFADVSIRKKFNKAKDENEIKKLWVEKINFIEKLIFNKRFTISYTIPPKNFKFKCHDDPKDNMVLEAAYQNNVDYLLTSDQDLLRMNNHSLTFTIISPTIFRRIFAPLN